MSTLSRLLIGVVTATYFGFFLAEAVFWTVPFVNALLLPQLNPGLAVPSETQVRVLTSLFQNQGAYNFMLGFGGLWGLRLVAGGHPAGAVMLRFLCLFGIGAATVLLATTHAYLLGAVQLIFPIAALVQMGRDRDRAA